jgi:preprotein translocase subunit SecA
LNVATDLEKAYESQGKQLVQDFEKNITLAIIDDAWKTHLRKMDELKQSVQLAVHEQKDEIPNMDERAAEARAAGNTQGQRQQVTETIVRERPKIGRNDKVTIKHVMSGENKTLKYKQAIPLLDKGEWVLVDH